ncbi:hypothetical protein [Streptomyces anulatus]|nr:hypothetical protein OG536_38240 [Streptomyces anulatus]
MGAPSGPVRRGGVPDRARKARTEPSCPGRVEHGESAQRPVHSW